MFQDTRAKPSIQQTGLVSKNTAVQLQPEGKSSYSLIFASDADKIKIHGAHSHANATMNWEDGKSPQEDLLGSGELKISRDGEIICEAASSSLIIHAKEIKNLLAEAFPGCEIKIVADFD